MLLYSSGRVSFLCSPRRSTCRRTSSTTRWAGAWLIQVSSTNPAFGRRSIQLPSCVFYITHRKRGRWMTGSSVSARTLSTSLYSLVPTEFDDRLHCEPAGRWVQLCSPRIRRANVCYRCSVSPYSGKSQVSKRSRYSTERSNGSMHPQSQAPWSSSDRHRFCSCNHY